MSIMSGPNAPAPAAPQAPVEATSSDDGRRRLFMLAGGGVALLLVAALAYFFLFQHGGGADVAGQALPAPAPKASAPATTAPKTQPVKSFAGKTARDPFKPVVVDTSSGSGTSTGATGTTGTTSGSATGTTTGSTSGGTTTPVSNTLPTSTVPLTVKVTTIASDKTGASFSVKPDGGKAKAYSPKLGETFAVYFKLTGFVTDTTNNTTPCVLLQYGDASTTLCKGATLTLK